MSSASNTLKKKKGHQKNYNRPELLPSGMLDAYVDSASPEGDQVKQNTSKPVSTKNKNKKKLEQRRIEEAAKVQEESQKPEAQENPIVDSWEDIDSDFEPPAAPLPRKEVPSAPNNKNIINNTHEKSSPNAPPVIKGPSKATIVDPETSKALEQLHETITKMSQLFLNPQDTSNQSKQGNASSTKPMTESFQSSSKPQEESSSKSLSKPQAQIDQNSKTPSNSSHPSNASQNKTDPSKNPSDKDAAKSKEDVKAEREAKKAAKAARRAVAKGEEKNTPEAPPSGQKPPHLEEKGTLEEGPKKSNAELKAERRAKQEAQRAAKATAAAANKAPDTAKKDSKKEAGKQVPNNNNSNNNAVPEKKPKKKAAIASNSEVPNKGISNSYHRKIMLFSHLPIYERSSSFGGCLPLVNGDIHPVFLQLGLQYSQGTIAGSNARCVSLLHALKRVISDYVTPPQKELSRDLEGSLKPYISFLAGCRTLSVSMENALRYVRSKIMKIDHSMSDEEAKDQLMEDIDDFILVNIVLASKQIAITAREKIKDGDVILTYGHSSLVRSVFLYAAQHGAKFRVIVADSRPKFDGKEMVRHLVSAGIKCTYVLISAVPYIMREVSKVIVGASSVLANGTVNSRVGTSQVALIAKASNVPVLVCCETYKFSERVQTDSFVFNELGDPNDLVSPGDPHEDWQSNPKLNLLNLCYDITPASLVDAIISEISVIPGTSVPVVLRLKNAEANIK